MKNALLILLFVRGVSLAQMEGKPPAPETLQEIEEKSRDTFEHFTSCRVYQTIKRNDTARTYLVHSFNYDSLGNMTGEVMGNFQGKGEYYEDMVTVAGSYEVRYVYDATGKLTEENWYYGKFTHEKRIYTYGKAGLLQCIDTWRNYSRLKEGVKSEGGCMPKPHPYPDFEDKPTWNEICKDVFFYDERGKLIRKNYYHPVTGFPYEVYTYTYDSLGRIKTEKMEGQVLHWDKEWKYLKNGYEIHENYLGHSIYHYRLDKKGRVIRSWWTSADGARDDPQKFYYDKLGRLRKETVSRPGKWRPYLVHRYYYANNIKVKN